MKKIYMSPNTKWATMTIQNVMQASLIISDETVEEQWSKEQTLGDDPNYVNPHSVWEE